MSDNLIFSLSAKDKNTKARMGTIHLPHGDVHTPAFMPVGTNGSVKAINAKDLLEMDTEIILGNTYHLYLRPGMDIIKEAGSLHDFISWDRNILTDSGGYQVFSLAPFRKIRKDGVYFRSHIDGAYHLLTPEKVVEVQTILNSDIMMPLDVCTSHIISEKEALDALVTTTKWAKSSKEVWLRKREEGYKGSLFGIIQGNFYKDLRKRSAEELNELDFPGIAIGGLSVGESEEHFNEFLEYTAEFLPEEKPHYLMGIGTPEYILAAVENGIDIFDCVYPTRIARNGTLFTREGIVSLKREAHKNDFTPVDASCDCYTCRNFSKAYLRHLFKAKEILGPMLTTHHNLYFMKKFMIDIRQSIAEGRFSEFKTQFLKSYQKG